VSFTVEDRHLIECLQVSKGYGDTFVQDVSRQTECNVDGVKTLVKKIDMTGSIDWSVLTDSREWSTGRPSSDADHVGLVLTPANINQVERLSKWTHCSWWKSAQRTDVSLGSFNTIIKIELQLMCITFHQTSIFSNRIHYLQICKYDVSMTSPVAMNMRR